MKVPESVLEATRRRWEERRASRGQTRRRIEAGSLLDVDNEERVRLRLERLAGSPALAPALRRAAETEGLGKDASAAISARAVRGGRSSPMARVLERVLGGSSELLGANFLEIGAAAARSVGRINLRGSNGRTLGFGTGFLVSSRLLLTNHHVLATGDEAARSDFELGYQDDTAGRLSAAVVFDLDPEAFFLADPDLDFALVAVRERSGQGAPLADFGWSRLIAQQGKVLLGECVNIVQHPNGEPKQLALRANQVIDLLDGFIHYETDTLAGSSGSPVFNDQWEVVALHHSGVPRTDTDGNYLTWEGEIWTEEMGEDLLAWVANEGVRISSIVERIGGSELPIRQQALRSELLGARSSTLSVSRGPLPVRNDNLAPESLAQTGGSVVVTVPIEVTVRVGAPVSGAGVVAVTPQAAGPARGAAPLAPNATGSLDQSLSELERAPTRPYYERQADGRERDRYYQEIDLTISGEELFRQLSRLLSSTHRNPLRYQPSTHVYPWVDLHPDLKLRSIYSGKRVDAREFIEADFEIEERRREVLRTRMAREAFSTLEVSALVDELEAQLPFNCEHVVPQSWFNKREPMRGDLHHLFACEPNCNSFRGNIPFFDFDPVLERDIVRTDCGRRDEGKFEPQEGRGPAARAVLYFLLRYPGEINRNSREYTEDRLETLVRWHRAEPPDRDEYERHRNAAVQEKQGNRNPLIDFPELGDRIAFRLGLG
jgi:endonuclease G